MNTIQYLMIYISHQTPTFFADHWQMTQEIILWGAKTPGASRAHIQLPIYRYFSNDISKFFLLLPLRWLKRSTG